MRSVLIATAALALLLAPTLAQARDDRERDDRERDGTDRLTTCEVWGDIILAGNSIANIRVLRGGFDPDITIDDVEPLFSGSEGIDLCEALAEKEKRKLCKQITRQQKPANAHRDLTFAFGYSFKRFGEDLNPELTCNSPMDPGCLDFFGATPFKLVPFEGGQASGLCTELLR
jgi:hypothetical protein